MDGKSIHYLENSCVSMQGSLFSTEGHLFLIEQYPYEKGNKKSAGNVESNRIKVSSTTRLRKSERGSPSDAHAINSARQCQLISY